ncbi:MAG: DUF4331 domain-containing protein [Kouleothrix sp.]|nr:DUF4331 domain-containing protein [Kouleothrix sp.]
MSIVALFGLLAAALAVVPRSTVASSHREAPLISKDPSADNTDLYAFVSPDKPDTLTIVANYIPLEEPAGGPNFNLFDDSVLYEIHVDNTGDSKDDITYQFRFKTKIRDKNTFLYNFGQITAGTADNPYPNLNYLQTYDVIQIKNGNPRKLADDALTPPINVGPRSTPGYDALVTPAITPLRDGGQVFAGPRDDPFFVDLGSIFDLGGLRPFNGAHVVQPPSAAEPGIDGVGGYNTHAIVIQLPIKNVTRNGKLPASSDDPSAVVGIYASASRQTTRVLRKDGSVSNSGSWVQVSRLGNPLINEVIIPIGKKDYWNAVDPSDDSQFVKYYQTPTLAGLVNFLYPALPDTRTTGRDDLVGILLTGLPLPGGHNLNFTGSRPADLLRLNLGIAPTHPVGQGDPLGVLNGDLAGFPNGRRLEDDVTDVELRAVADGYGTLVNSLFGLPNNTPNNQVGDGVNVNDLPFLTTFPYVAAPHQGYEHEHHAPGSTTTPVLN